ncbi:MAG: glycosyltransferase family 39 protein [Verrucomicrobiota bacterium]|nr:glycosyltransferase family 39 protein [Verrucomicrobiota bacterium]
MLAVCALRLPTMFNVERTGWDERAYVVFAQTLDKGGVAGLRQWLHDYPVTPSLQKSPLFLRVGFILPALWTCKILGGFIVDHLAWLSFLAGVGLVVLGAHFANQLVGRRAAMICGALLITSPLAAGLSRRATQDTFAALTLLGCLFLFDACWRRRSALAHLLFGLCLTLAFLTKESAVLLYPIMGLAALYYWRAMKLRPSLLLLLALVLAPLAYLLIEIALCGSVANFTGTYRTYASLQQTLDYTVHFEKGPWFAYLVAFLAIAPLAWVGSAIGLSAPVDDEGRRHGRNLALIYLSSALLLFAQLPVINVRLVLFADVFVRIGTALAIVYVAGRCRAQWTRAVLIALIALVMIGDSLQCYRLFWQGEIYSPTTFLLLRTEGFYDAH